VKAIFQTANAVAILNVCFSDNGHSVHYKEFCTGMIARRLQNPERRFHTTPLEWNDKPFLPILDHERGNIAITRQRIFGYSARPRCAVTDAWWAQ